jgi:fructose-1,6-bisphosphatase I
VYVLYGSETILVYSTGNGVHEFILDLAGNWVLSQENMRMETSGDTYSPGGKRKQWEQDHVDFIDFLEKTDYTLRYSGSLVADFHNIMVRCGGIFCYPKLVDRPNGKLRLLIELQPLAFIAEQANGKASDGNIAILDRVPTKLDECCPVYIGSTYEVDEAKKFLTMP